MVGPDPDNTNSYTPTTGSRVKKAGEAAGRSLNQSGQDALSSVRQEAASAVERMQSYKRGGKVRKTGPAKLHRGELVIPRGKVKRVKEALRKTKRKSTGRS